MSPPLSEKAHERYARQLRLAEIGPAGQRRLREARVLLVGAGGLGSPAALYLAAAGVGHLDLVDDDTVALSNLQRQLLYDEAQLGRPKSEAAGERLRRLNGDIEVLGHALRLDAKNAATLVDGCDVVIDGTDNLATRELLNRTCLALGVPWVYGAVQGFEGQLTVFSPGVGPCYRCLYPREAAAEAVPSCAEVGVLGVVPGVVGTLQASEALKLLLGVGSPLVGRLLVADLLGMRWSELRLARRADCPACGAVVASPPRKDAEPAWEMDCAELRRRMGREALQLVDVREPQDGGGDPIEGAVTLRLSELAQARDVLDPLAPTVLYCRSGIRSRLGVEQLRAAGFAEVHSLAGGLAAFRRKS